jgi:cell division protein FtsI (penicillin-binding protein 3)
MNNKRALFLVIFVFIFFIVLLAKLADVQIVKSEEYKYYAQRQQTSVEKIKAQRGMIYDRNNVLLAYNRNDISFFVDLRMAKQAEKNRIAEKFSEIFKKGKKHYLNLMSGTGKTVCIEKKAPGDKALLLKNFKAVGFFSREDPTRIYHYESLASHVLGYISTEFEGAAGVEKNLEQILRGENGTRLIEKTAIGDLVTIAESETRPAIPGLNVYLTINKSYQALLEEELKSGLKEYKAVSATGILMDPNSGEILALANVEDYDPNIYWKYPDTALRNRALTDTYEPGSTFKAVTMAALLDRKLAKEDELVFVENGKYIFKRARISDTHKHDWLTVKGVFEQSSNVGMAKLVQKIDDELYYKYLRGFGFGNITSIELPGEAKGKLKKPNEWSALTKVFTSFGYELSVTPLQLVTAYSALVNGGILYQPRLIKKNTDVNNNIVFESTPKNIRRVISEETSEKMREFLAAVVEKGTGKNAKSALITTGGKTGTSQQLIKGKYSKAHYNSSFVGFFPVEHPEVVCLILVNSPEQGRYGSLVAAPIFKRVAERIYRSNPSKFEPGHQKEIKPEVQYRFVDSETGTLNEQKNIESAVEITEGIMPDLKNYSVRDAILTLTKLGVKYNISGSGKVYEQSVRPGTKLTDKIICKLFCSEVPEKTLLAN